MLDLSALDLMQQLAAYEARENFWAFRRFMHPDMKVGWWQKIIAEELQEFYVKLINCERPTIVIEAPPQHGKSEIIVDFIAWFAGRHPDKKTIYGSFSESLGIRANLSLRRIFDSAQYRVTFPGICTQSGDGDFTRTRFMLEYQGHRGFFRNTTVEGAITGQSLDLGIIDDPLKGRKAANSKTTRDNVWGWIKTDFFWLLFVK